MSISDIQRLLYSIVDNKAERVSLNAEQVAAIALDHRIGGQFDSLTKMLGIDSSTGIGITEKDGQHFLEIDFPGKPTMSVAVKEFNQAHFEELQKMIGGAALPPLAYAKAAAAPSSPPGGPDGNPPLHRQVKAPAEAPQLSYATAAAPPPPPPVGPPGNGPKTPPIIKDKTVLATAGGSSPPSPPSPPDGPPGGGSVPPEGHSIPAASTPLGEPSIGHSGGEPPITPHSGGSLNGVAKSEGMVAKFNKLSGASKTAIIGGVVLLGAVIGYWVFASKNEKQEEKDAQKTGNNTHSR